MENQNIHIAKENLFCKAAVFGAFIKTLNRFELLFMFANKLQKISKMYLENVAVQTSIEHFKEVVKTVAEKSKPKKTESDPKKQ